MSEAALVPLSEQPFTMKTLQYIKNTPAIPARYEGRLDDMIAAVMYGNELGIGPMVAINELYLVDGKISMSGKLMSDLVHRRGHQLRISFTTTSSKVEAYRRDPYTHQLELVGTFTFSDSDAKKAGLSGKATYKLYPQMMRTWRAITFACRTVFSDCLGSVGYLPEELDITYENGEDIEPMPDSISYIEDVDDPEILDAILEVEDATANIVATTEVVDVTDIGGSSE
jgi:hypothetical protein